MSMAAGSTSDTKLLKGSQESMLSRLAECVTSWQVVFLREFPPSSTGVSVLNLAVHRLVEIGRGSQGQGLCMRHVNL
eukprot:s3539_g3.t1